MAEAARLVWLSEGVGDRGLIVIRENSSFRCAKMCEKSGGKERVATTKQWSEK